MTEFELIMVMGEIADDITDQFEFWIGITIAVVVACYSAGEKLSKRMRSCISILYFLACLLLYLRYLDAGFRGAEVITALNEINSAYTARLGIITDTLRQALMIGTTLLIIVYINFPAVGEDRKRDSQ